MLHLGNGNYVPAEKVSSILSINNSKPIKEIINNARQNDSFVSCTNGGKTLSLVLTKDHMVYGSVFSSKKLVSTLLKIKRGEETLEKEQEKV